MDFYNTNFWGMNELRYSYWGSIYPPISFIIGKIFNTGCEWVVGSFWLRECSQSVFFLLLPIFVGCYLLSRLIEKKRNKKNGIIYFLLLTTSLPVLYSLERGNYILFAFLLLSIYVAVEHNLTKAVCIGLAVNFKPYLIILLVTNLVQKNYRQFLLNFLSTVLIYFISLILLNDGSLDTIIDNIVFFSQTQFFSAFEKLWYTSSLNSYLKILATTKFLLNSLNAEEINLAIFILSTLKILCVILMGNYIFNLNKKFQANDSQLNFLLILFLMIMSDSAGGYATILLLPFLTSIISLDDSIPNRIILALLVLPVPFFEIMPRDFDGYSYLLGASRFANIGIPFFYTVFPLIIFVIFTFLTTRIKSNEK